MDNELDILNTVVGGIKIKDMSAMTFIQIVAKKIDGMRAYSADVVELTSLVSSPPMGRFMPDEEKIRIVKKLIKHGATF